MDKAVLRLRALEPLARRRSSAHRRHLPAPHGIPARRIPHVSRHKSRPKFLPTFLQVVTFVISHLHINPSVSFPLSARIFRKILRHAEGALHVLRCLCDCNECTSKALSKGTKMGLGKWDFVNSNWEIWVRAKYLIAILRKICLKVLGMEGWKVLKGNCVYFFDFQCTNNL